MNPIALRLVRWTSALVVAVSMTGGSLALVAWMNDDPSPTQHEAEHEGPRPIPVIAPPPPPTPSPISSSSSMSAEAAASTPAPSVAPPAPAPPQLAGLVPGAGPGGMPVGRATGSLPSMGTLPGSGLSDEAPAQTQTTPARPRSRPKPRYPRVAQRQGIEGFVTVRLRIDATGRVADAVVVKSEPRGVFDDAAMATARRYRFTPARRDGEPVETTLQQTIRFELQK